MGSYLWQQKYSSFSEGDSIRYYTQSKDGATKYVFLFNFPTDKLLLTKIAFSKNTTLQLLGSNKKLTWKQKENAVEITIPESMKAATDSVWVIKVSAK
jgi:hypothetical protein